MSESHEPIFEPERHRENEGLSPEVDLNELEAYLADTTFEDESAVIETLHKYGMKRRESTGEMRTRMTLRIPTAKFEDLIGIRKDELVTESLYEKEPEKKKKTTVRMMNNDMHELTIYEVPLNQGYQYDFTLKKL